MTLQAPLLLCLCDGESDVDLSHAHFPHKSNMALNYETDYNSLLI